MFPISDPILVFTVLLLAMLLAPILSEKLRLPDVVLLLVAGTLLGPNGLGILERSTAVTMFGSVGILYIMFVSGLELDLHDFVRMRRRSIVFGLLTFAIPQFLGAVAVRYLFEMNWVPAILLASMFASHTLLAYPIASRLGIARSEPVGVTVGSTIITNTLALLVLTVIAESARGIELGPLFWMQIVIGMILLFCIIWWGIPWLTRWFFLHVTEAGSSQFLFVFALMCGCAYASRFAMVEPIIGAFIVGASFNRMIPERSTLRNRITFVGNTLFIPFFLISVGMLINFSAMVSNAHYAWVAFWMVLLVVVTKYMAAWSAGKLFGYDHASRQMMFGLSVVQAAATLAAVLIGYELKIFDEAVLNGAIAMIVFTCPLGAWVVDRFGRRLAEKVALPSHVEVAEQRILVPVANPDSGSRLLDLAFLLRDTSIAGAIHPITIIRDEQHAEASIARGEHLMAHCLSHAAAANIPVAPLVRVDFNPSDAIIRAAKELRSTLVLAGWGVERALRAKLFGSVTTNLLDACPSRIICCRLVGPLNTTKRVLLFLTPMAERRSDIASFLGNTKLLSNQIGAGLQIYLAGIDPDRFRQIIDSTPPHRPFLTVESSSIAESRDQMLADIRPDDLLLIQCERRSSPLWVPTLDGFTASLALRFPKHNLMAAYPALDAESDEVLPETTPLHPDQLSFCACDIAADLNLEDALLQMVTTAFPSDPLLAAEGHRLLNASSQGYPVELSAGAVLMHGHSERLKHPMVIIGSGKGSAWTFVGLEQRQNVLVGLLSPKDQPPERHLKSLSELARRFYDPDSRKRIEHSASAAEICRVLQEGITQG